MKATAMPIKDIDEELGIEKRKPTSVSSQGTVHRKQARTEIPYTSYELRIRRHHFNHIKEAQWALLKWQGTITFITHKPILNELEVARDLEVLLMVGQIPNVGSRPLFSGLSFNWKPSKEDTEVFGDEMGEEGCIVTLVYTADIDRLTEDEIHHRIAKLEDEEGLPLEY
jgi:hypothetical protein